MYYNRSFHQHYLGNVATGSISLSTSAQTPADLTKGQIGLFVTTPQGILQGIVPTSGTTSNVTLVQGSWHTVDQIGQGLAGYQVPIYSKMINWRYVTQFIKRTAVTAQNQVVSFGWDQTSGGTGPVFYCGTSYYLKIEGLGEPALTFLNKQIYNNLSAWGGCCGTDCSSGCTSTAVDAASIMLQWSDRVRQNPYLTQFFSPAVYIQASPGSFTKTQVYSAYDTSQGIGNGTYSPNTSSPTSVIASFQLTVAYVNTEFGNCTFSYTDRHILEPLYIQGSLVTQNSDPCAWNTTINTSVPNMFTQLTAPKKPIGKGWDIIQAFITSNRYRQYTFPDNIWAESLRMREAEDDVSFNVVPANYYDQIVLIHTVPRPGNPTSTSSNDQYAIIIDVPTGTTVTTLTNIISNSLTLVGSNVTLQTY